ncbi:MAG TPA: nuclear transport factor 2 family protein [Polyangia bacterium]|jgi:hypothetical protein
MAERRAGASEALLAVNESFYRAFVERDFAAMENLWSATAPIACIHPGWNALRGRELVIASWRSILSSGDSPQVVHANPTVHLLGDAGFIICEERVGDAVLVATNVFVLERGGWKMVHHQAAPVAQEAFELLPGIEDDDSTLN